MHGAIGKDSKKEVYTKPEIPNPSLSKRSKQELYTRRLPKGYSDHKNSMNPYTSNAPTEKSMSSLFALRTDILPKTEREQREELLEYFARKLGRPIGYIRFRLKGMMDLPTLYYLKSISDRYENERNGAWGKCWYGALKVVDNPLQ